MLVVRTLLNRRGNKRARKSYFYSWPWVASRIAVAMQSNNNGPFVEVTSPAIQAVKRRWCFKIVVLGDSGIGKTWLVETALTTGQLDDDSGEAKELASHAQDRFYHQERSFESDPDAEDPGTIGVTFNLAKLELDGSTVLFQVWDTSGKERYRGLLANYMTDLSCVIVAYNPCCDSAEACSQSLARWHQFALESAGPASKAAAAPLLFCVVAIGGGSDCRRPQTCDHVRSVAVGRAFADTLRGRFFQCRRPGPPCQAGGDGRCDPCEELTAPWLGRELLRRHFMSLTRLLEEEEDDEAAAAGAAMTGNGSCCQRLAKTLHGLTRWPLVAAFGFGRRLISDRQ